LKNGDAHLLGKIRCASPDTAPRSESTRRADALLEHQIPHAEFIRAGSGAFAMLDSSRLKLGLKMER